MKKAIYAGSFDPFTNGHLYVVRQALEQFDTLFITVATNPNKSYLFSAEERKSMIEAALVENDLVRLGLTEDDNNVHVVNLPHDDVTVKLAMRLGVRFFVRGLRDQTDMIEERKLYNFQTELFPNAMHCYIMPPDDMLKISSSYMKWLAVVGEWNKVAKYVPTSVLKMWKEKQYEV